MKKHSLVFFQISGEKSRYEVAESEISEVGMVGIYPRDFNDDVSSQTSESLRYIEQEYFQALFYYRYTVVSTQSSIEF